MIPDRAQILGQVREELMRAALWMPRVDDDGKFHKENRAFIGRVARNALKRRDPECQMLLARDVARVLEEVWAGVEDEIALGADRAPEQWNQHYRHADYVSGRYHWWWNPLRVGGRGANAYDAYRASALEPLWSLARFGRNHWRACVALGLAAGLVGWWVVRVRGRASLTVTGERLFHWEPLPESSGSRAWFWGRPSTPSCAPSGLGVKSYLVVACRPQGAAPLIARFRGWLGL